jgi:hypothetical protein
MSKSLLSTNPYLKNTASHERALSRNVESSSAVEGIQVKRDAATGRFIPSESDQSTSRTIKKKAQ